MIKFLRNENGFVEHSEWQPYCWVNVECPDADDVRMLLDDFGMPAEFLDSVADIDERPRAERNGVWKLIILRVPVRSKEGRTPFITVPIGIVTNNEIVVTICYHYTELIPDFINHTRRKGIAITSEADFILRLIYSSTYWFLTYLKEINRTIAASVIVEEGGERGGEGNVFPPVGIGIEGELQCVVAALPLFGLVAQSEMHREEMGHVELPDENPGAGEVILAEARVDRKECEVYTAFFRRGHLTGVAGETFGHAAQAGAVIPHSLADLLLAALLEPYPGVEVAGVENAFSSGDDHIAVADIG